jgi:hypothetical protein
VPTNEPEEPTSEREQALLRLKKRRDLQALFVTYLIVNAAVWIIWATTGTDYRWPASVIGGWGIALLLSTWDVYGRSPITEADVQREMEQLHHHQGGTMRNCSA